MEVRQATDEDLEQIVALQIDRNGADCGPMVRALVDDPANGIESFTVAADGDRVVSSLCLIREHMTMEGITFGVGQPEFVATHADYEHRGLIRAQMDIVHEWSAARRDLVQIIAGIPYFYRQFGYSYAIPFPRLRLLSPGVKLDMPDGWSVRRATDDDVEAIVALEAITQAGIPLVTTRGTRWWRWSVGVEDDEVQVVAVRDGRVHGSALVGPGPWGIDKQAVCLRLVAGDEPHATWALLAHAAERGAGKVVGIDERTGIARVAEGVSLRHRLTYDYYVRIPDVVALFDHLRPVLSARLGRSHYARSSGSLLVSFYKHSLTIDFKDGEVIAIERGGPDQTPARRDGIGVPPDLAAALIFGRFGALELEERSPDVRLGRAADLADILFPRLETDIVTSL